MIDVRRLPTVGGRHHNPVGAENSIWAVTWAFAVVVAAARIAGVSFAYRMFCRVVELLVLRGRREKRQLP